MVSFFLFVDIVYPMDSVHVTHGQTITVLKYIEMRCIVQHHLAKLNVLKTLEHFV